MSVKFGGKNISNIRLGTNEITKMYLGSKLIFETKNNEDIPTNLIDFSNYTFPITTNGITVNYNHDEKSISINGTTTGDFGINIPLSINLNGKYIHSYTPTIYSQGFYLSFDNEYMLHGWGVSSIEFEAFKTTSNYVIWFDNNTTYNNVKIYLSLIKLEDNN